MPTLLQINTFVNSRSTGRIAEEIGKLVMAKGWESYIAYGRDDRPSVSKKIQFGTKLDVLIHGLFTRFLDRHGLASTSATKKLIKKIDKVSPDIIHFHNLHGYYLDYKLLFQYLSYKNIPVVWTLHDCWTFTGHCVHYDYVQCYKWINGCEKCPLTYTYPKAWRDRSKQNWKDKKGAFTSLASLTLVPVSHWLSNEISHSFFKNIPYQVISNGIDINLFKPVPSIKDSMGLEGKFMMIGVANVWGERKGLNDFIALSRELPPDNVIVLVGVTLAQKKMLPANIVGISRTESIAQLVELYSSADVCLNISYEETFGMTTIEAFACGTPGIVYNATASPELITPETGIIVEKGNISELVKAVYEIRRKGKDYYSQACRERAEKQYSKDKCFKEYIDLYDRLLIRD